MRTGYALRPVSLYNTVHTDSFTVTIINNHNNHNNNNTNNKKPVVDLGSVFSTQAYPKSVLIFYLWHGVEGHKFN